MREILFRGKRPNGQWVQGDLTQFRIDEKVISKISFHTTRATLNGLRTVTYTDEVIPETIGQYTGLTDKNGTKIFEGDIVTSPYYLEKDKTKNSIIEYGEWNCSCCNGVFGWVSIGVVDFRDEDVIVIGNIHDNPELLKE